MFKYILNIYEKIFSLEKSSVLVNLSPFFSDTLCIALEMSNSITFWEGLKWVYMLLLAILKCASTLKPVFSRQKAEVGWTFGKEWGALGKTDAQWCTIAQLHPVLLGIALQWKKFRPILQKEVCVFVFVKVLLTILFFCFWFAFDSLHKVAFVADCNVMEEYL